jgi:hypothetical protein
MNPGVLGVIQRSQLGEALGRDAMHFNLAGCGKTTARLKMLSRVHDFRDKGRVLVASAAACVSFSSPVGAAWHGLTPLASSDFAGGLSCRQPRQR